MEQENRTPFESARRRRPDAFVAATLFVLALAVRGLYLVESSENPTFLRPILDSWTYHKMAADLAVEGRITPGYFWQPFLYPLFLSAIYHLTGPSVLAAKLVQALLGSVTCVLVFLLGRRVFSRAVGLGAGLILVFYGPLIFFETELIAAGLAAFWMVALCLLILDAAERPTAGRCFSLGLCTLAAIITRPTFLPFCGAAWLWLVWRWIRRAHPRPAARFAGALLLGFLAGAVPLAAAFKSETGRFTIFPQSGGINLYVGNNPNSPETLVARPGWRWQQITVEPKRHGIEDPWEAQAYFIGRVREYLFEDPAEFAAGIGRKSLQFISSREIPRNLDPYLFARWSVILSILNPKVGGFGVPFGLLLPLAVLGAVYRRRDIPGPVWLGLFLYPAAVVLVFVSGRYRVPVIPLLAVLASAGAGFIFQTARRRRWVSLGLSAALAVTIVLLGTLPGPFREERPNYEAEMLHALGTFYFPPDQAEPYFRRAIELDPQLADAYVSLAHIHHLRGESAEVEALLGTALRIAPNHQYALSNRATSHLNRGEYDQAVSDFDKALQADPSLAGAFFGRGLAYSGKGQYEKAIADFQAALELNPHFSEARESLAAAKERRSQIGADTVITK